LILGRRDIAFRYGIGDLAAECGPAAPLDFGEYRPAAASVENYRRGACTLLLAERIRRRTYLIFGQAEPVVQLAAFPPRKVRLITLGSREFLMRVGIMACPYFGARVSDGGVCAPGQNSSRRERGQPRAPAGNQVRRRFQRSSRPSANRGVA
jgi:hypothetical protein